MTTQVEAVLYSNESTPPEYRVICEGLPMEYDDDKWVVIRDFHKTRERVKGDTYAMWHVLCERDFLDGDEVVIHPYIVWTLIARPEGWSFNGGDYCSTYEEAEEIYKSRLGI